MKYTAFLALMIFLSLPCAGQTPAAKSQCSLTTGQSPEIRGIRLGMGADKLLAAFPEGTNRLSIENAIKESKRPDAYGTGRVGLSPVPADPRFSGVNYISVELLDERVTSFQLGYVGPQWTNVDLLIAKLAEALKLPSAENWAGDVSNKYLKCDGFAINAFATLGSNSSSVLVRDESAPKVFNDRREAAKEKGRKSFKP